MNPIIDPFSLPLETMLQKLIFDNQSSLQTPFPDALFIFPLKCSDRKTELPIRPIK